MPKEQRETAVQKLDREWRELAIDSIADLTDQIKQLTERIHQGELQAAVMKQNIRIITVGFSLATSVVTTLIAKWIMKS